MKGDDFGAFCQTMEALGSALRGEVTAAGLRLAWLALRDELSLDQLERAAARALKECEFMPTAGRLIELARSRVRVSAGELEVWLGDGMGWGAWKGTVDALPGLDLRERKQLQGQLEEQRKLLAAVKR